MRPTRRGSARMNPLQEDTDGTLDAVVERHSWLADLFIVEPKSGDWIRHRRSHAAASNGDSADLMAHRVSGLHSTEENAAAAAGAGALESGMSRSAAALCGTDDEAVPRARDDSHGLAQSLGVSRANAVVLRDVSDT